MERKRYLFQSTINFVSRLWDGGDERPTNLEASPVNDSEDQVRFVVKGSEHQRILGVDSDQPESS